MNKLILIAAAVLMLVSIVACNKGADPKNFATDYANIVINSNGDCDKAAKDINAYFDANMDAFVKYVNEQVKAGKNPKEVMSMNEDLEKKMGEAMMKCVSNESFMKALQRLEDMNKKIAN